MDIKLSIYRCYTCGLVWYSNAPCTMCASCGDTSINNMEDAEATINEG